MSNRRQITLIAALVGFALASGCARGPSPKKELLDTESSIQSAIDVGAEEVAPDELAAAQSRLTRAHQLIKKKEYDDARDYLRLAKKDAELALRTVQLTRERDNASRIGAEASRLQSEISEREARLLAQQEELDALKDLQAKQTDRGMVLTLGDVLFNTNESTLNQGAQVTMDRVAAFMRKYPERVITIEGHTDNTGDENYNYDLSLDRANEVMAALNSRRIEANRIATFGKGESLPLADNNTAAGRQQNRRVEILFNNQDSMISEIDY